MNADIVIIGGGIIGSSCAFFLAREGVKVVLVERGGIAGGTSSAGECNILVSDKIPGPELALAQLGRRIWQDLADELADDFEFDAKGGILVAETGEDWIALEHHTRQLLSAGVNARLLSGEELYELEPYLARDIVGAALFPEDAQGHPPSACRALVKNAQQHGLTVLDHTEVLAIERDRQGAIRSVVTSEGTISTPCVINAAGPWSKQVAGLVDYNLPVLPRKGYVLVTERLPTHVYHKVMEVGYTTTVSQAENDLSVAAVIEGTRSGHILLGSSRQFVGFDETIEQRVVQAILQRAQRFFPAFTAMHSFHVRTGFRPYSPDSLPIIGEVPGVPGFYVNSGHEGTGFGLGPISGKLLSQLILKRVCDMS
ncbi:MAG: FAD-binding oxidoreductase, partial [Ktedonobacteraceae bacterium]|nr:FAD-binding oxidoreductase [Ktedonobacteraceae bacterium]